MTFLDAAADPLHWLRRLPAADADTLDSTLRSDARLAAVRRSNLLDSESEDAFDGLTRLAAKLLGVPAAFVSVVDGDRDFYKSQSGFPSPVAEERELRGRTFCHYTLDSDDMLVIDDTHSHPLWRAVPTVQTLGVRAYVGVPLKLDKQTIGSFCVIDVKPRRWTPDELETLQQLGRSAGREIGLRGALSSARVDAVTANALVRAREEVVALVAHDLRTPLQVLSLGTSVVQLALGGRQEATTTRMQKALQAMTSMVDSLLSTSALMAPSAQGRQDFDGAELARDAIAMMSPIAERAGIELVTGNVPPAALLIDYAQMLRVLGNLIGNAIKYSPQGSVVTLAGSRDESSFVLEVRDNGRGMSSADQARAFERGWQGGDGMVRGDGAGLGLSIARTLIEQHGGSIGISGAEGVGTTLTLKLPCQGPVCA